jgi:acyl-CoA thioester hydrolase
VSGFLQPRASIVAGIHRFPIRVYYEDTDAAGIVYYANYFKFVERARTEMMRALGIEHTRQRAEAGIVFVVRRLDADFHAPARLDDALTVATRLTGCAGASLELEQIVERDEVPLVRVHVSIACLGPSGRPARLPPMVRAALASLNPSTDRMVASHAR